MTPETVGVVLIVIMLALLAIRLPLGITMIFVALVGTAFIVNPGSSLAKLGSDAFANAKTYTLSAMPLFIFMGTILAQSQLGQSLYQLFDAVLGRVRGGLAMGTIGASAVFGAVSGSAVATASTIAPIAVTEMQKFKYSPNLAAGSASIGATMGIVVPPSSTLILYGAVTEESIGDCLIAGIIPGILATVMLMLTAFIIAKVKPAWAPLAAIADQVKFGRKLIRSVWIVPVIFLISIGGIYMGVFSPTEAGAVGAFLAMVLTFAEKRMNLKLFWQSVRRATQTAAMTFMILISGMMFGRFITLSKLPLHLSEYVRDLDVTPYAILAAIFVIYFVMGCLMDEMAILVVMTPIIYPIIISLGFNGVWFAIFTVLMLVIGLVAPPVGVVSLVTAAITKVPALKVFSGVVPFWFAIIAVCVLITVFPEIVTFLPSMKH